MTSFKYVVDSIEQDMESPVYLVTTNTLPDLVSGNTYALFSRSTMPVLYGFFANGSDVSNIDKENMIVIMPNTGIIVRHPTFTDDTGEHLFVSREDGDFGRIHLVFTEGASSSGASGGEGAGGVGGASKSVGTDDLDDGAVTRVKIADDAVSNGKVADDAIDTAQIADDAITGAKIADDAVDTAQIDDGAVTRDKIVNNAINSSKLANSSVNTSELVNGAVETNKIDDDAVTNSKIAANAVGTSQLISGSVTTAKLSNNSVTNAKLGNNSVTNSKITNDAVTSSKIADDAVGSAQIADGAVNSARLASNAVTNSKMADDSVDTDELKDDAVTSAKVDDGAITGAKISDNTITGVKMVDNTIDLDKIKTTESSLVTVNVENAITFIKSTLAFPDTGDVFWLYVEPPSPRAILPLFPISKATLEALPVVHQLSAATATNCIDFSYVNSSGTIHDVRIGRMQESGEDVFGVYMNGVGTVKIKIIE